MRFPSVFVSLGSTSSVISQVLAVGASEDNGGGVANREATGGAECLAGRAAAAYAASTAPPHRPMTRALLVLLAVALWSPTDGRAQDAPTPPRPHAVAQDHALVGTWRLVNGPLQIPSDAAEVWVDRMQLTIWPSDGGDSLSAHTFEVRLAQERRTDGARDDSDATSRCALLDNGVVSCQPSHEGTQTGWWHLGLYALDGGTLTFSDPSAGFNAAFRRVAEE